MLEKDIKHAEANPDPSWKGWLADGVVGEAINCACVGPSLQACCGEFTEHSGVWSLMRDTRIFLRTGFFSQIQGSQRPFCFHSQHFAIIHSSVMSLVASYSSGSYPWVQNCHLKGFPPFGLYLPHRTKSILSLP
jgi:hypothetical protein